MNYILRKFLLKHVFRKPISAQKQDTTYAKFACLDGCHLTGKFKGMLICATNQDFNGTIFILARGLVPREDEENWLYFLRHFRNAGLANSIIFFMSTDIKVFKNKYGQQISDILQHKARSYNAEEYQMYLDPLRTEAYGEEINNWIHNADPKMWCSLYIEFLALVWFEHG